MKDQLKGKMKNFREVFPKAGSFVKKHRKLLVCVAVMAVLVAYLALGAGRSADSGMSEAEAVYRDIYTYRSFSGNVEAVTDTPVIAKVSAQVTELLVSEGDEVKEGDVLAVLDSSAVEDSIELKEAALGTTQTANAYAIQDAQRNYDDYKEALDQGLNSSLVSAQQSVDSARSARDAAIEDYDDTEDAIDEGTYSGTMEAYNAKQTAKSNYEAAVSEYNAAVSDYNAKKTEYEAAKGDEKENAEAALDEAQSKVNSTKSAMDTAESALETAKSTFRTLKSETLDAKQDAIDNAETALRNAEENYAVVELQVNQQLESYEAALAKSKATSSTETSQTEIAQLEESLDDYTLTAPCDGTVTDLNLTEGAMAASGTTAFTISGLDSLEVAIQVDEYSILDTQVGSKVTIYADSIDMTYIGTLTYVSDVADLSSGVSYFEATVTFQADDSIKSGMSVEVRITSADEKDVLAVPSTALDYYDDNTAFVLVKNEEGKTEERPVEIGVSDGSYTQIISGLTEGDIVYVSQSSEDAVLTPMDMVQ